MLAIFYSYFKFFHFIVKSKNMFTVRQGTNTLLPLAREFLLGYFPLSIPLVREKQCLGLCHRKTLGRSAAVDEIRFLTY